MPTSRPVPPRRLAAALAATLLLVACSPTPTAVPTPTAPAVTQTPAIPTPGSSAPPAAEAYAAIRKDVEAIRGLEPSADVDPVTIDEAQLITNLTAEFDSEYKPNDLHFTEDALIALGLLSPGSSLRDLTLDLQGSNVAGYYSPDKDQLFVVSRSGALGPAEEVTYAHEFTHQLQDQNYNLFLFGADSAHEGDKALAQLALVEGDAVSVQNRWTTANLTPEELGQLLQASLDPEALAALQRAPAYLRETSLFPYLSGNPFVESLIATVGGYKGVNAAFAKPPISTEQILHAEKYAAGEAPKVVKLPTLFDPGLPAGWMALGQDTLGEFLLRLWLIQGGVAATQATTAAAGWGGDRLELYQSPGGTSLLVVTEWDGLSDAAEFAAAATVALPGLGLKGEVVFDERSPTVYMAVGDDAGTITPRFFR